mgnify:CR=1 FL=1
METLTNHIIKTFNNEIYVLDYYIKKYKINIYFIKYKLAIIYQNVNDNDIIEQAKKYEIIKRALKCSILIFTYSDLEITTDELFHLSESIHKYFESMNIKPVVSVSQLRPFNIFKRLKLLFKL